MCNYVKVLSAIIFGLFALGDINAKPWNNNTREHLFGYVDNGDKAHVSIQDEGFRWRNSFNFTINGQQILPQNWWFMPVVSYDRGADFVSSNEYRNNYSPDLIHSHLAGIADKVKAINGCASTSAAAITIVVENEGNYYAFSKTMSFQNKPCVATTYGENPRKVVNSIPHSADLIKRNINNIIDCNIPEGVYSCSEGKILSKLTEGKLAMFKETIKDLLLQARQKCQNNNLNYDSVKSVVLHIGTTMDPCAICTRCLVGISKRINENIDSYLRSTIQDSPEGRMSNAKFLVEVSSNGHYLTTGDYNDNFAAFGCGKCSHTECAGHDGGEGNSINVSLDFPSTTTLAIPYGVPPNWTLSNTFPPYVVFGRINVAGQNVIPAPGYNQGDGTCDNRKNNTHLRHACINNLPLVR